MSLPELPSVVRLGTRKYPSWTAFFRVIILGLGSQTSLLTPFGVLLCLPLVLFPGFIAVLS